MCVMGGGVTMAHVWKSKDQFAGLVLPLHFNVGSRVSSSGHQAGLATPLRSLPSPQPK